MELEMNSVLNEYDDVVTELTRKLVFARAENTNLRDRLAQALNEKTHVETEE